MWIVQRPFTYEHWLSILCKLRNCCFILNRTILHIRENGRRNVRFFHLLRTFELVGNFPLADTEWGTGGTFSDSSSSQETQWLFYWLIPNKSILKCCNFCCAHPNLKTIFCFGQTITWPDAWKSSIIFKPAPKKAGLRAVSRQSPLVLLHTARIITRLKCYRTNFFYGWKDGLNSKRP